MREYLRFLLNTMFWINFAKVYKSRTGCHLLVTSNSLETTNWWSVSDKNVLISIAFQTNYASLQRPGVYIVTNHNDSLQCKKPWCYQNEVTETKQLLLLWTSTPTTLTVALTERNACTCIICCGTTWLAKSNMRWGRREKLNETTSSL